MGSGMGTLSMSGSLTNTGGNILLTNNGDKEITKAGTGSFIIRSTATVDGDTGTVDIESVKFAEDAVSGMGTLSMSGDLTNTNGNIALTKSSGQTITKGGSGDLTVESDADTKIEQVTFAGTAVSGMGTLSMSGSLTNTGGNILLTNNGNKAITKAGTGSFIISSSATVSGNTGTVDIESVKFAWSAVSGMGTLSMSGSLTNSGADILLTRNGAQAITKSVSGDL